ncbi:MAG: hypothetical protein ACTSX6_12940 [Candidatus Heimdallarchaeaceae archaeon]
MNKTIKKISISMIFVVLFLFFEGFVAFGDVPVIASRISKIDENFSIHSSGRYYKPNNTLFSLNIEEEILNRAGENQTVVEAADCDTKACINASFVNQSLEMEPIGLCLNIPAYYTYPPGITKEYETIMFYINQTGLTQLPDGNYTLGRPINTAAKYGFGEPAEVLVTRISIIDGVWNISYPNFTVYPVPELSSTITLPVVVTFLFSYAIAVVRRRKRRI